MIRQNSNLKIRFILSSKAGKGVDKNIENKIKKAYEHLSPPDICYTKYEGHTERLAKDWSDRWKEDALIYIGGGDGSLNEVAKVIKDTDSAMGVLPLGTGNDFSKTVYKTTFPEKLLDKIISKTPFPTISKIDMLKVNSKPCLNLFSIGYDTVILQSAYDIIDRFSFLGKSAYIFSVIKNIFNEKNCNIKFTLTTKDSEIIENSLSCTLCLAGNGRYYGSGYNPLPNAMLDDGLGDFLYTEKLSLGDVIRLIPKYRKGVHLSYPKVKSHKFLELTIESTDDKNLIANYDGIIFSSKKIDVKVLPKALNFAYLDL